MTEPQQDPKGQEPEPQEPQGQEPGGQQPNEPKKDEPQGKTFDESYVKQLRSEAAAARKSKNELEARLKEFEDRDKSESEKLAERLAEAEKARDETATKLTRFEVAAEKKLPGDLVELLTGTKEEMEAKADVLLQHIKESQATPDFGQGAREPVADPKKPEQAHNDLILALTGHLPPQQ